MEKLAKALRGAMAERNHSATKAAAVMGVSPSTPMEFAKWLNKHWPFDQRPPEATRVTEPAP